MRNYSDDGDESDEGKGGAPNNDPKPDDPQQILPDKRSEIPDIIVR